MRIALFVLLLLVGCAAQNDVTLMPRGHDARGSGTLDRMRNVLTVDLDGKRYSGTMQMQTASSTSYGALGSRTTSTTTNAASALLLGDGGQVRCDFGWDALMTGASGVCVDAQNRAYDMLVK